MFSLQIVPLTLALSLLGCASYVDESNSPEYSSLIGKEIPTSEEYGLFCPGDSSANAEVRLPKEAPRNTCLMGKIYPGALSSKWKARAIIRRGTPVRLLFVTASAGLGGAPGADRAFGELRLEQNKVVTILFDRSSGTTPLW